MAPNAHHRPHPHFYCLNCGQMECLDARSMPIDTGGLQKTFAGRIDKLEISPKLPLFASYPPVSVKHGRYLPPASRTVVCQCPTQSARRPTITVGNVSAGFSTGTSPCMPGSHRNRSRPPSKMGCWCWKSPNPRPALPGRSASNWSDRAGPWPPRCTTSVDNRVDTLASRPVCEGLPVAHGLFVYRFPWTNQPRAV